MSDVFATDNGPSINMETLANNTPANDSAVPSAGKLGIWLFLASEVMFFMGILGSYVVLRSSQHDLFARHAEGLSKPLAGLNTLILIFSSLTMAISVEAAQKGDQKKLVRGLLVTLLCAGGFLGVKSIEYLNKFHHHTIVAREADGRVFVYDGHEQGHDAETITLSGARSKLLPGVPFDIHLVSENDVMAAGEEGKPNEEAKYTISRSSIVQDVRYGPGKNMFYACYFTLTALHGIHVVGGMIAIFFLLVQSMRGKVFPAHTEHVGLYWHFVDLVWIFLFPLLYLV